MICFREPSNDFSIVSDKDLSSIGLGFSDIYVFQNLSIITSRNVFVSVLPYSSFIFNSLTMLLISSVNNSLFVCSDNVTKMSIPIFFGNMFGWI